LNHHSALSLIFYADIAAEPLENIIYEGVLSNIPIGRVEAGESCTIETALSFLAYGAFDIVATVRSLESGGGCGRLSVSVLEEI
jgi:trafficking protein particle complex subunit 9